MLNLEMGDVTDVTMLYCYTYLMRKIDTINHSAGVDTLP